MTTPNSLPQPSTVVEAVEAFFDSLPATRRRRIVTEPDTTPESENYTIANEPDNAALVEFRRLLRQLGQARSDVVAEIVTVKIYRLLGLTEDDK